MSDWIKVRGSLRKDPRVLAMADCLLAHDVFTAWLLRGGDVMRDVTRDITTCVVVTALIEVWATANQAGKAQDTDLVMHLCTLDAIDKMAGVPCFGVAMEWVDWAIPGNDDRGRPYVLLPRFLEHNTPASSRPKKSAGAERQAAYREREKAKKAAGKGAAAAPAGDGTRDVTGDVTVTPREEKSREDRTPPNPRKRGSGRAVRFEDFWLSWPKNERKQDKAKCLEHWQRHELDDVADAILNDVRTKRGTTKWGEGFIEAPLVYLRGRRWEDGVTPDEGKPGQAVTPWHETRSGIIAKGVELDLGPWSEEHWSATGEQWPTYRAKVFAAAGHVPARAAAPAAVAAALAGAVKPVEATA